MADTLTSYAHDNSFLRTFGRSSIGTGKWQWTSYYGQRWFRFYGKKLEFQVSAAAGAGVQMSIDGGAFAAITTTSGGTPAWHATPAWSGTEGWHDVVIAHPLGYNLATYFNLTEFLRVTGTDGNEQLDDHPDAGEFEYINSGDFVTYGISTYQTTSLGTGNSWASPALAAQRLGTQYGYNTSVRRRATWSEGARLLAFECGTGGAAFGLKIDGRHWGTYTGTVGRYNNHGFVYADLPGSGTHEIEIMNLRFLDGIMIRDGSFEAEASTPKTHALAVLGDSQTYGAGANNRPSSSLDSLASQSVDCVTYNLGTSGNKIGGTGGMIARFAGDVTPHAPTHLMIHAGYNTDADDVTPFPNTKISYKSLLDTAISELPSLAYIFCLKVNDMWGDPPRAAINQMIDDAVSEWLIANSGWSSKLIVLENEIPTINTDANVGHISGIGYCQIHGENTGTIKLTAQPSDGDTVTLTAGGVSKVFEFDSNATVAGSNIAVTIGADTTETNLNLWTSIVAQSDSGWSAIPLIRVTDAMVGCGISNLSAIAKSGTNLSVTGPFSTGLATTLKTYLGAWPPVPASNRRRRLLLASAS